MYKLIRENSNSNFLYQGGDKELDGLIIEKPVTIYQALLREKYQFPKQWEKIMGCYNLSVTEKDDLDVSIIFLKVIKTNTCTNCDSPIEVWIDPEGKYRVAVYDEIVSG